MGPSTGAEPDLHVEELEKSYYYFPTNATPKNRMSVFPPPLNACIFHRCTSTSKQAAINTVSLVEYSTVIKIKLVGGK